ncbi:MAG: hypothetical protein ABII06_12460, partial [Pseudomonadota bacterium]
MADLIKKIPSGVKDVVIVGFPEWNKIPKIIFSLVACGLFFFSFYTGAAGVFTTMVQRPMHLMFMLFLFPFLKSSGIFKAKSIPEAGFSALLSIAGVFCLVY